MRHPLRILFAGKQHFDFGGIESSTDQLARRLLRRGHTVAAMSMPGRRSRPASARRRKALEEVQGYAYAAWSVHRMSPGEALGAVISRFHPDAVIVNAGGSWWHDWTRPLVRATGAIPCVLYIRDPEAVDLLGDPTLAPDAVLVNAESHAAAARAGGHNHVVVVPSLVEPDDYVTTPTGEVVLYVNPVKSKGVRTALTLAASRRDIPFVFLRSWRLPERSLTDLARMSAALGNIEVAGPTTDMREFYARARLLLAPYEDDGRPRVVAEAQLSGLPVLARDDAGLREAVGPGGILIPPDAPPSAWVEALGRMWDDVDEHRRLADAAAAHSRRPEMAPEAVVAGVEAAIAEAIANARRPRGAVHSSSRPGRATESAPLVTVVIPVHNGASTIDAQLRALVAQSYAGEWELVICDNGSTDDTRARALSWEGALAAELRIVDAAARRGVGHARNVGILAARGEYVLICDADDVVSPDWVQRMVDALRDHEIVTGALERRSLNTPEQYAWTGDEDATGPEVGYGYRPYASGGNLGVRRDVALGLGGFDERLSGGAEDVDWSWRAQYAGHDVFFEPGALIHYRMRSDIRSLALRRLRGGFAEPFLYRRHRHRGMGAEPPREVLEVWRWLARNARAARRDPALRYRWTAVAAQRTGRLLGSIRHRARFL